MKLKLGKLYLVRKRMRNGMPIADYEKIIMHKLPKLTYDDMTVDNREAGVLSYGQPFLLLELGKKEYAEHYKVLVSDVVGWINMAGQKGMEYIVKIGN